MERTINGAYGEAEPTVLVSVQSEEDGQVCDRRQDDGRGAQSGSAHEELTCYDGVTQTGDLAEGQSHGNATHGMAEASDFDETRTSHDEDKGESEVDENVVREEGDRDDERETDAAFAVDLRQRGDGVDECEDGQDAEAEEDDGDAQDVDGVAEARELRGHELVGALDEEEVQTDFATYVEDEAEVDGGAAAAFRGKIPRIDEEAGREDERNSTGVNGED